MGVRGLYLGNVLCLKAFLGFRDYKLNGGALF